MCPPAVLQSEISQFWRVLENAPVPSSIDHTLQVNTPSRSSTQGDPGCHSIATSWDIDCAELEAGREGQCSYSPMPPFLHAAKAAASGGPKSVFKSATAPYFVTSHTLTAVFCATVVRGPIFPEASWADTIDGRESAKSTADLSNIFNSYGKILGE